MARTVRTDILATGTRNEVRMILLGRTGTGKSSLEYFRLFFLHIQGKSAFGNTILGQETFEHKVDPDSVTTYCTSATREVDGKKLFVVDTPGFLDTVLPRDKLHEEIAKSYQMTAMPGPHAFLLVLDPIARYTPQEYESFQCFSEIFGPKAVDNAIVVFTHTDRLAEEGKTIEKYLNNLKGGADHPINKLLDQFQRRYLAVNNRGTTAEKDGMVKALLDMITQMLAKDNGQVYINRQFQALAKEIETEMSQGTYKPFNSDGSFTLLPQTKAIVIDGYLRRISNRRTN